MGGFVACHRARTTSHNKRIDQARSQPFSEQLLASLNPRLSLADLQADLTEIDYPAA